MNTLSELTLQDALVIAGFEKETKGFVLFKDPLTRYRRLQKGTRVLFYFEGNKILLHNRDNANSAIYVRALQLEYDIDTTSIKPGWMGAKGIVTAEPIEPEFRVVELKCERKYFNPLASGAKTFELRFDDRGYAVGDVLMLREYARQEYTGLKCYKQVTYIFRGGNYGLAEGWVILGLKDFIEIKKVSDAYQLPDEKPKVLFYQSGSGLNENRVPNDWADRFPDGENIVLRTPAEK